MIYINRNLQYPSIVNYTIFGERHSGTRFLTHVLQSTLNIPFTEEYGHKHWFGFTETKKIIKSPRTLFISIVRNPYDWIYGFFNDPFHVPYGHLMSMKNFVSREWYSVLEKEKNREIMEDRNYITGKRYRNILDMRKHKMFYLRHVLSNIADNYIILQYENFLTNYESIIRYIIDYYNIGSKIQPDNSFPSVNCILKPAYSINTTILIKINESLDWNIENHIGYKQRIPT